jgi:hypothetical protein
MPYPNHETQYILNIFQVSNFFNNSSEHLTCNQEAYGQTYAIDFLRFSLADFNMRKRRDSYQKFRNVQNYERP